MTWRVLYLGWMTGTNCCRGTSEISGIDPSETQCRSDYVGWPQILDVSIFAVLSFHSTCVIITTVVSLKILKILQDSK